MIQIRLATEEEHKIIAGFQVMMAAETENLHLDEETVTTGVISVFRNPEKGKYFVAVSDDKVIASLLITFEWSDWRNAWVWWIQSVYVLPDYRKKGIFKQMFDHIKSYAQKDTDVAGLRLYVDKTNHRAIKVYKKIGMNGEHYQVFEWMKH